MARAWTSWPDISLADRFARRIVAGPYIDDDTDETPNKEPTRGGPFDPGSFNDDQAPPKPAPVKPTPRQRFRPSIWHLFDKCLSNIHAVFILSDMEVQLPFLFGSFS
jgi:hypothetical protein